MKKGIEWLKEETEKRIKTIESDDISFVGSEYYDEGYIDGMRDVLYRINQLDEPEANSQIDKLANFIMSEVEGEPSQNQGAVDTAIRIIKSYQNQETLSQKWIDEHEKREQLRDPFGNVYLQYVVPSRYLQNLLVPKQELPVIPKFVAEVIEEHKERGYDVYDSIDLIIETNGGGLPSISNWVARNIDKYARAWLDGFTVEEEPLYRARLKVITNEFIASYLRTQSSDAEDRLKALEIGSKYIHEDYRHLSEFTEDELKRLNIWDSEQWEVEELEE